jgi:two-component system, cell cycle sensor histidine kinase and response regulator CckA
MTVTMLARRGFAALAANTPSEAVRIAERHSGEIDLLLTDVIMPEMNGRELAEALSKLRPHLKFLFMSGYTADVIVHRGVLENGVSFIQKPFSAESLAVKIREAFET